MTDKQIEVTQADREAGWAYRPSCYRGAHTIKQRWLAGVYDLASGVPNQAFAAHRIEATRTLEARLAAADEMERALRELRNNIAAASYSRKPRGIELRANADAALAAYEASK